MLRNISSRSLGTKHPQPSKEIASFHQPGRFSPQKTHVPTTQNHRIPKTSACHSLPPSNPTPHHKSSHSQYPDRTCLLSPPVIHQTPQPITDPQPAKPRTLAPPIRPQKNHPKSRDRNLMRVISNLAPNQQSGHPPSLIRHDSGQISSRAGLGASAFTMGPACGVAGVRRARS